MKSGGDVVCSKCQIIWLPLKPEFPLLDPPTCAHWWAVRRRPEKFWIAATFFLERNVGLIDWRKRPLPLMLSGHLPFTEYQLFHSGTIVPSLAKHHWHICLNYIAVKSIIGTNLMSACSSSSPPSFPRAYLLSHHPVAPPTPSPSPPAPIYSRLSNGSHSAPSPTNSRSSFHGLSFLLQIGLTRETVNLEANDLSLSAVKDLVCSIVDQKVIYPHLAEWIWNKITKMNIYKI